MTRPASAAIELAVFDLDGTLADTRADIAAATNRVLAAAGLPTHPLDAFDSFVGSGVSALLERAAPALAEPARASLEAAFRLDYTANLIVETTLFPGIAAALERLAERGVALAVLSNKPHALTRRVAEILLGEISMVAVFGQRDGVAKKPDPRGLHDICAIANVTPEATAMVGDTPIDVETARRAGARPIGVAWGFRPASELADAGALAIATTAAELADRILTSA